MKEGYFMPAMKSYNHTINVVEQLNEIDSATKKLEAFVKKTGGRVRTHDEEARINLMKREIKFLNDEYLANECHFKSI